MKKESGFTLVELMVVVAIIGILSAVAIPNFKRYQAKSKTSEAKLQLSAIYSALTSLQADYDAFATCLRVAGYIPPTNNYYAVGFGADNATARGIVDNNAGSAGYCPSGEFAFGASKRVGSYTAVAGDLSTNWDGAKMAGIDNSSANGGDSLAQTGVDSTGSYFVAGAVGGIDADNDAADLASRWAINENKSLQQIRQGY